MKLVTLNPPNIVKFGLCSADLEKYLQKVKSESYTLGNSPLKLESTEIFKDFRAYAYIDIINKSNSLIYFKVKIFHILNLHYFSFYLVF